MQLRLFCPPGHVCMTLLLPVYLAPASWEAFSFSFKQFLGSRSPINLSLSTYRHPEGAVPVVKAAAAQLSIRHTCSMSHTFHLLSLSIVRFLGAWTTPSFWPQAGVLMSWVPAAQLSSGVLAAKGPHREAVSHLSHLAGACHSGLLPWAQALCPRGAPELRQR